MARKLSLETTAPFQGLPELVAHDEGLFAAEGLEIEWVARGQNAPTTASPNLTSADGLNPFASHGSSAEQGKASMYNACEWGNYRRVQDTQVGSRQLGRRPIITYGAIVVAPTSDVYTPQQLANRLVSVPYYAGTHYLATLMLEGFLPRDMIKTCQAPSGSLKRYESLLNGEVDATTLTEPYITVAENAGCRIIIEAPYHATQVASDEVDDETYAAFNRALVQAVRHINADKKRYMQYFIDYHKSDPNVAALSVDDLPLRRLLVVEPTPIPADELQRSYEWMRSWGMIDDVGADSLVRA